jgi:DNA repair protein RecO (recombination protein O)
VGEGEVRLDERRTNVAKIGLRVTDVRVVEQTAFVLHLRPYRETSAIAELLTQDHGRVDTVARGVRGTRRKGSETLTPFVQLLVGWSGRTQLRSLTAFEPMAHHWLSGKPLFAGLYMNELLLRLLRPDDPHQDLFTGYQAAIGALADGDDIEPVLRRFERLLLRECGYELVLDRDADSGTPVDPNRKYRLESEVGFCVTDRDGYSGSVLLAIAAEQYESAEVRRAAKRVMRQALAPYLGSRPLHSRTLFRTTR